MATLTLEEIWPSDGLGQVITGQRVGTVDLLVTGGDLRAGVVALRRFLGSKTDRGLDANVLNG